MTIHDTERIQRLESALRDIARGRQTDMSVAYYSAHRCREIAREALGEWETDRGSHDRYPKPVRALLIVAGAVGAWVLLWAIIGGLVAVGATIWGWLC